MDTLVRFGTGDELYTFDTTQQISLRDNFRNTMPRTKQLPGLAGGYDEYGDDPAPAEVGNVQVVFWVQGDGPAAMETLKGQFSAMKAWGRKKLWKQPAGGGSLRFCEARINSIDFTEAARDVPHKRLRVQVNFQADPMWHGLGTYAGGFFWGDGTTWGSGATWGGTPVTQNVTGTENSFSVTPGGNDLTYPRFRIIIPAGESAENIRLQRVLNGRVVDQIRYSGTLSAGDVLDVDCRAYRVKLNGVSGYSSAFSVTSAAWFRLRGGVSNTIRVLMANAGDEADIQIKYFDVYNY